jgi:hypothetical protein
MLVWEIVFMLIILKIPLVWVCWVVWWSIKAEPEPGVEPGTEGINWKPWRKPNGPRPRRGGPHEHNTRTPARAARSRQTTDV